MNLSLSSFSMSFSSLLDPRQISSSLSSGYVDTQGLQERKEEFFDYKMDRIRIFLSPPHSSLSS